MNSRTYIISLIALATLAISACDRIPGAGLGTVVIDLAAVAKATGEDERIQQESQAAREGLNGQLAEAAANIEAQLTAERDKLGENPSPEQQQQYGQLQQQAQQQYGQLQQQAQQEAQRIETELVMNLSSSCLMSPCSGVIRKPISRMRSSVNCVPIHHCSQTHLKLHLRL